MSNYFLTPNKSDWEKKTEPFDITIIAYDNEGKRIRNEQLYIIYDLTYDENIPDIINNGTKVVSDSDGIITLNIDKKCRITIDIYMVSEYDETKTLFIDEDYIHKNICDNFIIPFAPYIIDFKAKYITNTIFPVDTPIPRKYVEITLEKSNNSTVKFTLENNQYKDYKIRPDTIEYAEDNEVIISYYDPILNKIWEYSIIVTGKEKELEINATYIGEEKRMKSIVEKEEMIVTLKTYDGREEKNRILDISEWNFNEFPQIRDTNLGILEISRNELKCKVRVPFILELSDYRLEAWYEGLPVLVGNKIEAKDFIIRLWNLKKGTFKTIDVSECQVVSENPNDNIKSWPFEYIVGNEGLNWYTVIYKIENWTLYDKLAIIGYIEQEYESQDFKLLYHNPNTHSIIDVTSDFNATCTVGNKRYFNWERILNKVKILNMYGEYTLYAPRLTGLNTRFDTEWFITCKYEKAISAELSKVFYNNKEELQNG